MSNQEQNLSPDEMAALRDVAEPIESAEDSAEKSARVKVMSYNFRQPGRLSAAQLRALTVVNEYFAKRICEARPGGVSMAFEMSLLSVETVSYSNFMGSLHKPCFISHIVDQYDHSVLIDMPLPIVQVLVARILGDDGEVQSDGKGLTTIEQAIAGNWVENLLPLLKEAWAMSTDVDFSLKNISNDSRFVQILPDDSPVVSLTFNMQSGDVKGQFALCYPLEPLEGLLHNMSLRMSGAMEEDDDSDQAESRILSSLKIVPFELRAELGRCAVRASQLMTIRKGDVLCLDRKIDDSVDVFLDDKLVFEAKLGRKGDNMALQLSRRRASKNF
jgi:flagellar motor switch protein FliM